MRKAGKKFKMTILLNEFEEEKSEIVTKKQ